jgi:hypothetical protein
MKSLNKLSKNLVKMTFSLLTVREGLKLITINKKIATILSDHYKINKKMFDIFSQLVKAQEIISFPLNISDNDGFEEAFHLYLIDIIQNNDSCQLDIDNYFNIKKDKLWNSIHLLDKKYFNKLEIQLRKELNTENFQLKDIHIKTISVIGDVNILKNNLSFLHNNYVEFEFLSYQAKNFYKTDSVLTFIDLDLTKLTSLDLSNNSISTEIIKNLSKMNFPNLLELNLLSNDLDSEAMEYFARMKFPKLKYLYLYDNNLDSKAMEHLSSINFPELEELVLSRNDFDSTAFKYLSTMKLPKLKELVLSYMNIDKLSIKFLLNMDLKILQRLYISYSNLNKESIYYLSDIELPELEELYLIENNIDSDCIEYILTMDLPKLKILDLKDNKLSEEEMNLLNNKMVKNK